MSQSERFGKFDLETRDIIKRLLVNTLFSEQSYRHIVGLQQFCFEKVFSKCKLFHSKHQGHAQV